MSNKLSQSNIVIGVVAVVLIAIVCGVVYLLSGSSVFDTSGGYIKGMAKDKDVITFMEVAETPSYPKLITEEGFKEYKDKPLKYWGYIDDKEVFDDKTAEYKMTVILNKEDTAKMGNKLSKTESGLALAPVIFRTKEAYNDFAVGDYIFMYGTVDELDKEVPIFDAIKLVLDTEM